MNELTITGPCILFALRREARAFCRRIRLRDRIPEAPCRARFCGPKELTVLVMETGIGPAQTENALAWLLARPLVGNMPYRPQVIIAAGFSGALQENWSIGDIILASEVVDTQGHFWPTSWPGQLSPGSWPGLHRGRILSATKLIADPQEKLVLGQQNDAVAVDMETAAVARFCHQHNVPFGCIRAISDQARTQLSPHLVSFLAQGRIAPCRLLTTLAKTPSLACQLWRLARDTRHAADQLALALEGLLQKSFPGLSC